MPSSPNGPSPTALKVATEASSFWAQKSQKVKSTQLSNPGVTEAATSSQDTPIAPIKQSPLLDRDANLAGMASVTNSSSPAPTLTTVPLNLRRRNWADSDDEDDIELISEHQSYLRLSATSPQSPASTSRIEVLEKAVATKDLRIQQLEADVQEKDDRISELALEAEKASHAVEAMKEDGEKQYLLIQELVAEVDEKDERIAQLKSELLQTQGTPNDSDFDSGSQTQVGEIQSSQDLDAGKTVSGMEIEEDIDTLADSRSQTPRSSPKPIEMSEDKAIQSELKVKEESDEKVEADQPSTEPTEEAKDSSSPLPEAGDDTSFRATSISNKSSPSKESPKKDPKGPTFDDREFPLMWTPPAPGAPKPQPAEKPKVLKMAIDTSKYGKKVEAKKTNGVNGVKGNAVGSDFVKHAKTDKVPTIEPSLDIRQMTFAQRVLFANGPDVDVVIGKTKVATVTKYVLSQCSSKAYKHFQAHPNATTITFPEGSMDVESAKAHLQWMCEMTFQGRVYSVTLKGEACYDAKNLKICQAARVLGLNNTYVGHFTKVLCDRIRSGKAPYEFYSLVCELAYPENDPVFDCVANWTATRDTSKTGLSAEEVEKLMERYPVLEKKVVKIQQRKGSA